MKKGINHLLVIGQLTSDMEISNFNVISDSKRKIELLGYKWIDVIGRRRTRELVDVRHCVYHYLYQNNWNYTRIAKEFNRNHASVLYAVRKVDSLVMHNKSFRNMYNQFIRT